MWKKGIIYQGLHTGHVHGPHVSDSVFCSTTQTGETALMRAASEGYDDIVQELLKHGASVNVQDRVCHRPCMFPHLCKVLHHVLLAVGTYM